MFKPKHTLIHTFTFICAVTLMLAACAAPPPARPTRTPAEPATAAPAITDTPAPPMLLPAPVLEKPDRCEPLQFKPYTNGITLLQEPINIAPDPDQPEFAQGLVIIVGIPNDIAEVVRQANQADPDMKLSPLSTITFQPSKPDKPSETKANLDWDGTIRQAFGAAANDPSVEISLHRTNKPISETVRLINTTANATVGKQGKIVIAQPDYMTGRIGGNPWTIGGNPWTIGGNPIGDPTGSGQAFWTQWGLQNVIDKNWIINNGNGEMKKVNIAIFDTSPFSPTGQYRFNGWFTGLDKLGWAEDAPADMPLVICASDPLTPHFQGVVSPSVDFSDHGAFVAGLTHAGAPGAHVELVRSLFDDAEGDAFSLLANLTAYGLTHQDALSQTVINLSLGMRPPTSADGQNYDYKVIGMDEATRDVLSQVLGKLFFRFPDADRDALLKVLPPDAAMAVVVTALTEPQSSNSPFKGATIVAAAGNDAFANKMMLAQLPARYPNVIGVESNNDKGGLSCFSNTVQPKTPFDRQAGGDCLADELATGTPAPTSTWQTVCPPENDCSYTVTSISVNERQWMRWRGTSFAAPIVSGMEARRLP